MTPTITAEQYAQKLEDRQIIIVGCKYTRNGWTAFKVYQITKYGLEGAPVLEQVIVPEASYWSNSIGAYKCGAWGTDRRLEIILSIGYALGLKFEDMRQNYQWLQDTY